MAPSISTLTLGRLELYDNLQRMDKQIDQQYSQVILLGMNLLLLIETYIQDGICIKYSLFIIENTEIVEICTKNFLLPYKIIYLLHSCFNPCRQSKAVLSFPEISQINFTINIFNDSLSKQNFHMYQVRSHRDHSETRPVQSYTLCTSKVAEPHQLTNVPYSGSTTFQVVVNNLNPMADKTLARLPSYTQANRPLMNNVSPRAKTGQSRERSMEEGNLSNASREESLRGRVVRANYMRAATKQNICGVMPYVPRDSKVLNKQNTDPQSITQQYYQLLRQKQSAQAQSKRLRQHLNKSLLQNQSLKNTIGTLSQSYESTASQLAKSKLLLANYTVDSQKMTSRVQELEEENSALRGQLVEAKNILPELKARFDKLERMNAELQEDIRRGAEEWKWNRGF